MTSWKFRIGPDHFDRRERNAMLTSRQLKLSTTSGLGTWWSIYSTRNEKHKKSRLFNRFWKGPFVKKQEIKVPSLDQKIAWVIGSESLIGRRPEPAHGKLLYLKKKLIICWIPISQKRYSEKRPTNVWLFLALDQVFRAVWRNKERWQIPPPCHRRKYSERTKLVFFSKDPKSGTLSSEKRGRLPDHLNYQR